VKISFSTVDPTFSEELANAHAAAFIRKNLETRFELPKKHASFSIKSLSRPKRKSRKQRKR